MFSLLKEDIQVVFDRDPAARSTMETLLCCPGLHAILMHRLNHWLWEKKTYLLAILDDATRCVVFAAFGWSEGTAALIDGLSMAIRRFGIPERFYTDNGSAFRSRHLAHVAAKLGMHLPHTPAYRPQGRGKVERFFRTVREQCLEGLKAESLETLQGAFVPWLDAYHHRIHDGIDSSPLNKRLAGPKVTRTLPEVAQLDLFFGMQERRKIHRNGTLHLKGEDSDVRIMRQA